MKIILDFIPNHTSENHPWFQNSQRLECEKYCDYYIWKDEIPNNWVCSIFISRVSECKWLISFFFQTNIVGEPAWTKSDSNGKYYFHNYLDVMPDLNLSNEEVINEIKVLAYVHHRKL